MKNIKENGLALKNITTLLSIKYLEIYKKMS